MPVPLEAARVLAHTNKTPKGGEVATRKPAAKRARTKKVASDGENGATSGRTRRDKLEGLSEAKRRNIAKLIYRERSKSPATSWGDIAEMIADKYEWELPGSMTGRRLLRDYGPDNAESAIIKQDRTGTTTKKRAPKKVTSKKKRAVEEDEDEEEEELDEEEPEDEYDEDEVDEDEDEEEEEEQPAPRSRKKVTVQRGRGRKSNPSKR